MRQVSQYQIIHYSKIMSNLGDLDVYIKQIRNMQRAIIGTLDGGFQCTMSILRNGYGACPCPGIDFFLQV